MRGSFADDATLVHGLFDLLDPVFPGLRDAAARTRSLGGLWEAVSTPFLHLEDGRPISHIGLIELPLIVLGRPVTVGSIHAVATHPEHRRRGHYRGLMLEVLEYAEGRVDTLILSTENPEYYEPFGFRVLQEHYFTVTNPPVAAAATGRGLRTLNLQEEADLGLLTPLLETREPVSRVVGCEAARTVFLFNEEHRPLHYAEHLDAVLCMERRGSTLALYDVVAPAMPSLEAILAAIPDPVEEVVIHFAPDRVAPGAVPTPYVLDHGGPSFLMAHGPFAAEGRPFTLPRSART